MLAPASVRAAAANYLQAIFEVYILIIVVYILLNLLFAFGLRLPYSRYTDMLLGFLRNVSEPYLRIFRRLIPTIGMFDFSPIIAIFVLVILDRLIYGAIS
jgi:YggT family protein